MHLGDAGLTVPDRIILYIDDLDRCTHQQVYDVLQAIHLLLAFELFVVVVGVDVRWIEQAVARQFAGAESSDEPYKPKEREARDRKRAIDYLEKIFQLPFWLRPLSTEGDGASYGVYVRGLLQANLEASSESPLAPTKNTLQLKVATGDVDTLAHEFTAPEPDRFESVAPEGTSSLDEALATVQLTQEEVDFLASPEIGTLAAKSPRSVKRMINVYRIVRARMSEPELTDFLGQSGKTPTWPIAVFLAAVECGQPVEVADDLYHGLKGVDPELTLTVMADSAGEFDPPNLEAADEGAYDAIRRFRQTCFGLWAASESITEARNGKYVRCGEILAMARIVRRYSFNRYH